MNSAVPQVDWLCSLASCVGYFYGIFCGKVEFPEFLKSSVFTEVGHRCISIETKGYKKRDLCYFKSTIGVRNEIKSITRNKSCEHCRTSTEKSSMKILTSTLQ